MGTVARALVIVLLALGTVGFGACALMSGAYGLIEPKARILLLLSLLMVGLMLLCIWGFRRLGRRHAVKPPPAPPPA